MALPTDDDAANGEAGTAATTGAAGPEAEGSGQTKPPNGEAVTAATTGAAGPEAKGSVQGVPAGDEVIDLTQLEEPRLGRGAPPVDDGPFVDLTLDDSGDSDG